MLAGSDYEIDRSRLQLQDILGEGQFGDVYRGIYMEMVVVFATVVLNLVDFFGPRVTTEF